MNHHPAQHMSIFGRTLFALLLFFLGGFRVKPRDNGSNIVRVVLQFRKIRGDKITPNLCELLRNEAHRRASNVGQPLLWGRYLPALFEMAHSAADYLKGHEITDAHVIQILDLETGKVKPT